MLVLRATTWDVNLGGDVNACPWSLNGDLCWYWWSWLIAGIGDAGGNYFNDTETLSMTDGWQAYTLQPECHCSWWSVQWREPVLLTYRF